MEYKHVKNLLKRERDLQIKRGKRRKKGTVPVESEYCVQVPTWRFPIFKLRTLSVNVGFPFIIIPLIQTIGIITNFKFYSNYTKLMVSNRLGDKKGTNLSNVVRFNEAMKTIKSPLRVPNLRFLLHLMGLPFLRYHQS